MPGNTKGGKPIAAEISPEDPSNYFIPLVLYLLRLPPVIIYYIITIICCICFA